MYENVVELDASAHTAEQAAAALGVEVGAIVKSLVFLRAGVPMMVLCSGANMVDEAALGLERARASTVREATGQAIGGVAPYGHPAPLETLVDEDLMTYDEVWAAAGHPSKVFPIAPVELLRRTDGTPARVRVRTE
ncbi:MAG: YbaK/EbsC family protein [Conexibacter sp.]|nr:YbaK/EbsC family protein [Conexibacter sp.]